MPPNSGIYTITNTENGKAYIGSTNSFKTRWGRHLDDLRHGSHHNVYLQRSWNKYGEGTFEFGVLEYLDSIDELPLAEQFWMDIYREENRKLYNVALTTDCAMRGRTHSKETRCKISKAKKGKTFSDEHKRNLSKSKIGKKHSKETRLKLSKARRGKKLSDEHRRRISVAKKGKPGRKCSEETKHKISVAKMGNKCALGHKHSKETRCKLSEASKGNRGFLGHKHSTETKRRISESVKVYHSRIKEKSGK